jgi:hypothetical protein
MKRDDFEGLRKAIEAGQIGRLQQMFRYVDQRTLFKAAGLNPYGPARKRLKDPGLFKISEVYQLAGAIGISGLRLLAIISQRVHPTSKLNG